MIKVVVYVFYFIYNVIKINQINNNVFFNDWSKVMIDDLRERVLIPQSILINPSYLDLVDHLDILSSEITFNELIDRCLMKFRYQIRDKSFETKINERRDRIIQQLTSHFIKSNNKDQSLRSLIKDQLSKMIINNSNDSHQIQFKDWRHDLLTNEIIIGSCRSLNDALTKTVLVFVDNYLSLLLFHVEKYSLIDSYLFLIETDEKTYEKLHPIWLECWTMISKASHLSILDQTNIEIPLVFDLHLPCATYEYEIIRQIRETIAQDYRNDNKNRIDFAWKQLISKSIYGQFINTILDDPDLFSHYYHDQITLARIEADIPQLSTSFIQSLISKTSDSVKDRLTYLLIDYGELFEIMRLFEIGIPCIGEEDDVLQILEQQIIDHNNLPEETIRNDSNLYRLVIKEPNVYLIPPHSPLDSEKSFECNGDHFIETSIMNLIELLISPLIIDSVNDIELFMTTCSLFTQAMIKLYHYEHYKVNNFETFNSVLRTVCCISTLFPSDEALDIFKQVFRYCNPNTSFVTVSGIHEFITYFNEVIHERQSVLNSSIIRQTLIQFENELLRSWFIENTDKSNDIWKSINDHDHNLWKYSSKIFNLIDKIFKLPSTIETYRGQIPQNDEYKETNKFLYELQNSTRKMEILMTTHIYMRLTLDENYQSRINDKNDQQIMETLAQDVKYFEQNIVKVSNELNEKKTEVISLIAWLRYYLQCYVYALKNDSKDKIMSQIDAILHTNKSKFCSTVKLYIIKQFCCFDNVTFHVLCKKLADRHIHWFHSIVTSSSNPEALNDARYKVTLPTPLFECIMEFQRINEKLSGSITSNQLKELINECSKKQDAAYCFAIWFIHYYSRFYITKLYKDDSFVKLIKDDVKEELINCFADIGYKLILSLCTNFNKKSYFHLNPAMSEKNFHQRLIVLNIIALLISF